MLSQREVTAAIGTTAYGDSGDKLGTVEHFFLDDRTGEPTWVAVSTGLFGTRHSIVPAGEATWADGQLRLPVSADAVKNAPAVKGDHLDPGEEAELRRHYGLAGGVTPVPTGDQRTTGTDPADAVTRTLPATGSGSGSGSGSVAVPVTPPVPASDTTARHAAPESTDGAMTRSEERLAVRTERVPDRRVRVVKHVVTDEVQVTVPIRREEIRIEEIPLDAEGGVHGESLAGDASTAGVLPEEIVLHAERPVVTVEVVPVERVRLRTELVQEQETVSGQVRREQVVVDEDRAAPRDRG
ncbi:DUF2382 domain-containing protein [Blastococcus saxobsidens]|uniref:Uncharacterized protein (TIGR02271 family) n=1 Tax=Blastococcus saxobsidens TaxID=138336 RepID=A0A4Q7Y9N7_9ACTN|nr:DUF2382 domain-containing protein [Blastococcus saxobsidens]RZU33852.1 uncharacterized protein (TIGR02271 family) [Blastococcus saxobsidens]